MSAAGREEAARKARGHAEQYDINRVVPQMLEALNEAAERFDARKAMTVAA
jgi:hypothetical protein